MSDVYDEYRLPPQGCGTAIGGAILMIVIGVLLLFGLSSCKSVHIAEKVNVRDSVAVHYKDSVRWNVRDSLNIIEHHVTVQDSSGLFIQFGQGGGTFNAKTGEATNVTGVQQTDTHHEQKDSMAFYRSRYMDEVSQNEYLSQRCIDYSYQLQEERKRARSGYDRFCSVWFWVTALLLLIKVAAWIMEKIPATAPYVAVVRKFVPFL